MAPQLLLLLGVPLLAYGSNPRLLLGVCGQQGSYDKFWPAVAIGADISRRAGAPVINVPGSVPFDVDFVFGDTFGSQDIANQLAIEWMHQGLNGTPVHAVVGCMSSGISDPVARLGMILKVPQISWFSGSHQFTKNHASSYGYFTRTIASMAGVQEHIVWILDQFGWRSATMLYLFDPYGSRYEADVFIEARQLAVTRNITITGVRLLTIAYSGGAGNEDWSVWRDAIQEARAVMNVVYVILAAGGWGHKAFELAHAEGLSRHTWIAGHVDNFWVGLSANPPILDAFEGLIGTQSLQDPSTNVSEGLQDFWEQTMSLDAVRPLVPQEFAWKMGNMTWPASVLNKYHTYLFDAVTATFFAFAELLEQGLQSDQIRGKTLLDALLSQSFEGSSGSVSFNAATGDRLGMFGTILNLQNRSLVEIGKVSSLGVNFIQGQQVVWPGNATTPPTGRPPSCNSGFYYDGLDCVGCGPGQQIGAQTAEGGPPCQLCPLGKAGTNVCNSCPFGNFSNVTGLRECHSCPVGFYCDQLGTREPKSCPPGSFSAAGATTCQTCGKGTFGVPQATHCEPCPAGLTTFGSGADSNTKCVCEEGLFHDCSGHDCRLGARSPLAAGFCELCPAGMLCEGPDDSSNEEGRHRLPRLPEGSMAVGKVAYLCAANGNACPGADLYAPTEVMCAGGGTGVACASCRDGSMFDGNLCVPCADGMGAIVTFFLLVGIGLVLVVIQSFPPEPHGQFTATSMRKMERESIFSWAVASLISVLATYGLFSRVAVPKPPWGQDFMMNFGEASDAKFGLECLRVSDTVDFAASRVLLANLAPAMFLAVWLFLLLLAKLRPKPRTRFWPGEVQVWAILPKVFQTFFIVIVNWAVNFAFSILTHPGGEASLQAFPYILESDNVTKSIRIISCFGIAIWCLGGLSFVVFVLILLPRKSRDIAFRRKALGITMRYQPETPWWIVVRLMADLLVAMTASYFEDGMFQVVWLATIFAMYLWGLLSWKPYHHWNSYHADVTATFGKFFLCIFATVYASGKGGAWMVNATLVITLVFSVGWVLAAGLSVKCVLPVFEVLEGVGAKAKRLLPVTGPNDEVLDALKIVGESGAMSTEQEEQASAQTDSGESEEKVRIYVV